MTSIIDFEKKIEDLRNNDESSYSILKRIYNFNSGVGTQVIPDSFKNKVLYYFGLQNASGNVIESPAEVVARIEHQKIINITNKWTGESTLFNSFRANRPGIKGTDLEKEKKHIFHLIAESEEECDFCQSEKYTPEDVFGRVKGKFSITAANIAKYDVWSSLVIFNSHNPLEFSLEEFSDYLKTGFSWFEAVNRHSSSFKYPFFVWNCLPRAGASIIHGHCQILMSKEAYAKVQNLQNVCKSYKIETGSDYFHDVYKVHRSLGLSGKNGEVQFFASITPLKEKEVIIISSGNPSKNMKSKETIFKILRCFIDIMGVFSFNLSISCPPIDNEKDFPYIIKIVDRGSILKSTADMGGMELYGSSVVADDPYKIIKSINSVF